LPCPVHGLDSDAVETALAGRADAIAFDKGQASVVLDWKSDVAPTSQDTRIHAAQLRDYMTAIGVPRGAVVYMTLGSVHWIGEPGEAA
jgi:CRISPR-associated exonuclease Cas4